MANPLDELLSITERSYIRLEAEQLITQCLDWGDAAPFFRLLEELVLAGASSLGILREVLGAIRSMKAELTQEGLNLRRDLMNAMAEFGVALPNLLSTDAPEAFRQICSLELRQRVRELAGSLDLEDQTLLDELCIEAGNKVTSIAGRMAILRQLESSVLDWVRGLAYEAAHDVSGAWGMPMPPYSH